jgi:hypothetical protein
MSVKNIIAKFEQEQAEIQQKIAALNERHGVLDLMLKEVRAAASKLGLKPEAEKAAAPKAPKAAKPAKGPGRRKGALTVRDAILKSVSEVKEAIPAKQIIADAVRLSGGAVASIRTQINSLTKSGHLAQVPYEGRGFKYSKGSGEKAAPKAKAKAKPKAKAKK